MNLKAKAFIFVAAGTIASTAIAEECSFHQMSGLDFQFDHLANYDQFIVRDRASNKAVYPDWFYDQSGQAHAEYDKFFRRHAKLQTDSFLRKDEPVPGFANKTTPVRYYKATVENCESLWVRIDENNPEFSRYFNVKDHKVDGDIPWLWEENTLNIRLTDQYDMLQKHVGKKVLTIPVTDNTIIPAYPAGSTTLMAVPEFAEFTLDAVMDNAFSVKGHLRSPYSLYVTDAEGSQWRLPWDPEYVSVGGTMEAIKRSEYSKDILSGSLVYGMSKDEVKLAWGAPHIERVHPILKDNATGREFIKNENFLHDGLQKLPEDRVFPADNGKKVGQQTWWFYPKRLEERQYLAFDRHGKLKKSLQGAMLYKKRSQPVEVAIERIRSDI